MTSKVLQVAYVGNTAGVDSSLAKMSSAHSSFASKMSSTGKKMMSTGKTMTMGLTLPIVAVGVSAVKMAMDFEKSGNTMQAVAGVSDKAMERLNALAMKLGRDTVFSANEAMGAMVELAKAGIKPAEIEAGALANTLDLATAGDLELADAATITATAMNMFNLNGKQSKEVVDALAGAANASAADVSDLKMALSMAGQASANAGLSIQETTAVLAEFADKGLRGSDAGTSLKTFLLNLIPTSEKAAGQMKKLGMSFEDAHGDILPMNDIADELQGGLKGLTQAEQQAALKIMFGTDAFRAASIVADGGSKSLEKYEAATSKVGSASKVADAKMKGLPGAIESLKGSAETFLLVIGKALAPMIQSAAKWFTDLLNKMSEMSPTMQKIVIIVGIVVAAIGPLLMIFGALAMAIGAIIPVVAAISAPMLAIAAVVVGVAYIIYKNWDTIKGIVLSVWHTFQQASAGIKLVMIAIATALFGPIVAIIALGIAIFKNWEKIKQVTIAVWNVIMAAVQKFWSWIGPYVKAFIAVVIGIFKAGWAVLKVVFKVAWFALKNVIWPALKAIWAILKPFVQVIISLFQMAWNVVKTVTKVGWAIFKFLIIDPVKAVVKFVTPYVKDFVHGLGQIWDGIKDPVKSAWDFVVSIISGAIHEIGNLVNSAIDIANGFIKAFNAIPGHGDVGLLQHVSWGTAAMGGNVAKGGMTLVGEKGPELLNLPTGSTITPNSSLGGPTVNVYVAGSVISERELLEVIKRESTRAAARNGGRSGIA